MTSSPSSTSDVVGVDFDELMSVVGEFGRFQVVVFVLMSFGILIQILLSQSLLFLAAVPNHWCATPELDRFNLSTDVRLNATIPLQRRIVFAEDGQMFKYSSCMMYNLTYDVSSPSGTFHVGNVSTVKCTSGWTYDRSTFSSTIVTEWNLVCDDAWKVPLVFFLTIVAQIVGCSLYGFLTDRFGRKRSYYAAVFVTVVAAIIVTFSPNYIFFTIAEIIVNFNAVACLPAAVILPMELVGVSWRAHVGITVSYISTIGYIILTAIAYGIREWATLQLLMAILGSLLLFSVLFVPESPRWLYTRGRVAEADRVMDYMTRFNGCEMPKNVIIRIQDFDRSGCLSFFDMLRTRRLRIVTGVLCFVWLAQHLGYVGFLMLSPRLVDNHHLNVIAAVALELPGCFIAHLAVTFIGRRVPMCCAMLLSGVGLMFAVSIPTGSALWFRITTSIISKLSLSASSAIGICYTAELYPTVIRGLGLYTTSLLGTVGLGAVPLVDLVGRDNALVLVLLISVGCIVAGLSVLLLPETRGVHLDDTVEDTREIKSSPPICEYGSTSTTEVPPTVEPSSDVLADDGEQLLSADELETTFNQK